jgi:hypothetical protein
MTRSTAICAILNYASPFLRSTIHNQAICLASFGAQNAVWVTRDRNQTTWAHTMAPNTMVAVTG